MEKDSEGSISGPELCICSGYQSFLNSNKHPNLWTVLRYLKEGGRFNHLRFEVMTWGACDRECAVSVFKRKADLPPEKGGPRCLGEVRTSTNSLTFPESNKRLHNFCRSS